MATTATHNRARSERRRRKNRLAQGKLEREAKFAARLAEVPELALTPYQLYQLEVEKRRAAGLPTCRPIEEHRRVAGVPDE